MKIGLMGLEFNSPNKGCEALTYSIINIISQLECVEPNSIIYNFSGTDLGHIPNQFSEFKFVNVKPKLKDLTFKYIRSILKCDVILDATRGDSFSDIYSENLYNSLIKHKKIAKLLCKNYILLPQTYGPFKTEKSVKKAIDIFTGAKKIYCRDEISQNILEKDYNIKNTELVSDMAFILPYNKKMYNLGNIDKKKLGINISGLLYKGGFNLENQFNLSINYKNYIEDIIKYFIQSNEYEIYLIPHVIDLSKTSYDDDYKICKIIKDKYPNCILAPAFNTPIEAKSYISNMDIFIGSRMHSTIASFSSGVVTIPVSYSRKFEGLFDSLNFNYVINGKKENTTSAVEKTIQFVNDYKEIAKQQKKSLKVIEEKNKKFLNSFRDEIKKIKNI